MSNFLSFISNDDLYRHTSKVLELYDKKIRNIEKTIFKNSVDPFSAIFESSYHGISLEEWLEKFEVSRQTNKTLSNAVGTFHEDIIGSVPGWERLPTGNVIDVKNESEKIIADIKNKWNTTKGDTLSGVYDKISSQLDTEYLGFTGYYVGIVPKKKRYDVEFTPSDNVIGREIRKAKAKGNLRETKKLELLRKKPARKDLRMIDGMSFYQIVTKDEFALDKLYRVLPLVIRNITPKELKEEDENMYIKLFQEAYARQPVDL